MCSAAFSRFPFQLYSVFAAPPRDARRTRFTRPHSRPDFRVFMVQAEDPRAPPRLLNADVYGGGGSSLAALRLRAGVYLLALRPRLVVQSRLQCRLSASAEGGMSISPPKALPDLLRAANGSRPLDTEDGFLYSDERSRRHVFNCVRPYSAVQLT